MPVLIAIILLPFGALSRVSLLVGQQHAFLLSGLIVAASLVKDRWLRYFLYYVSAWVCFVLIGLAYIKYNPQILNAVFQALIYFTAGTVIYLAVIHSKYPTHYFYNTICVSATIQAVLCWMQVLGIDLAIGPFADVDGYHQNLPEGHFYGTLFNDDYAMGFLAVSLPFFYRKRWLWGIVLISPLLLMSKVVTAIAAAIISTGWFCFGIWAVFGVIPVAVYAWFFDPKVLTDAARYQWWSDVLGRQFSFWPSTVFGFGPGCMWDKVLKHSIHSSWVTLLYQYGLIGFALILGYLRGFRWGNKKLTAAFISACIVMVGTSMFHVAPLAALVIIILGLMAREKERAGLHDL